MNIFILFTGHILVNKSGNLSESRLIHMLTFFLKNCMLTKIDSNAFIHNSLSLSPFSNWQYKYLCMDTCLSLQVWVKDLHPTALCKDSQKGACIFKRSYQIPNIWETQFLSKNQEFMFPCRSLMVEAINLKFVWNWL